MALGAIIILAFCACTYQIVLWEETKFFRKHRILFQVVKWITIAIFTLFLYLWLKV